MARNILTHYSTQRDYFWLEYCIDDAKVVIQRVCLNYALLVLFFPS